jgi:hypothetical protein
MMCCFVAYGSEKTSASRDPLPQRSSVQTGEASSDPVNSLATAFPNTIALKEKGRLLEFCPDGTCDGFVASNDISTPTLKDFAFLYEYFFSEYVYLNEWRVQAGAKRTAQQVLSEPVYQGCQTGTELERARCILLSLSRGDKIKLFFVRYDEGHRGVVSEDIVQELAKGSRVPAK